MVKNRPFRLGLLLIDGFALMSYASVVEPLRAANQFAGRDAFAVRNLSVDGARATSSCGTRVPTENIQSCNTEFDWLLIVAGGDPTKFENEAAFAWLRGQAHRGRLLGGVSGGPVILVRAGLMNNRRMTVHWEHAASLTENYPELLLERSLYVIDRDRVTCAGGTAPLDLMHALIAEHDGPTLAGQVSDWFMHTEVRPSGGPQRAGRVSRYRTTNPVILRAIEAMENHIADPLALEQLALIARVSVRQLNRLFRDKLGKSTIGFYRDLRLVTAENLLANSSLRITEIALATGFANAGHLSSVYRQHFDRSPSAYRRSQIAG